MSGYLISKINIKSKTLQDLLKVLSGNIVAQGIGFLTIIVISRDLGADQYGIFSLLLAIFTISVQISDFGISTSYVKYVSENLSKSKDIFFTIIITKIILSLFIILILYFIAQDLSGFFFNTAYYTQIIQFISFAILFHSIFSVVIANFQAQQKFKEFALLNILHNFFKFLSVMMITILFLQKHHLVYFLYTFAFSVILVLMLLVIKYKHYIKYNNLKFNFKHFIEIYKLGFWIFLSSLAVMIIMRLDIMMLQKMSSSKEVGYYSVAMNLAMIFPLITASLVTTLLPKLDEFLRSNSIKKYVYSILSKVKYVIVMLLIIEILAPFIIKIIFGCEYHNSIKVFQILIIAFTFGIIVNPISLLFYKLNKAYWLTILNWVQLPLNYLGNLFFIPFFQAEGAALSTVLLRILAGFFIIIYFLRFKYDN